MVTAVAKSRFWSAARASSYVGAAVCAPNIAAAITPVITNFIMRVIILQT
jgi:hypothetical protein